MEWDLVYDFAHDLARIESMRRRTLDTDEGWSPEPAIVGSKDWWNLIRDGIIPVHTLEGRIKQPTWTGMGDWAEVEVVDSSGRTTVWNRLGDIRQYCRGRGIRLRWVDHRWKRRDPILGDKSEIELAVWLQRGEWRFTTAFGPGLGGHLEEGWEGGPA